MQILLCAATPFEIELTASFIREEGLPVSVLITGVGLVATTYALTKALNTRRPDLVLQAGIGGSLDPSLPLGRTFAIRSECIGDIGVMEGANFLSLTRLGLLDENEGPWEGGKLPGNPALLEKSGFPVADGLTVNEISTDAARIQYYAGTLGAAAESMEGAALHFVGRMEKIPFLQVRSLSNFAGERDKSKWMLKEAIRQLNTDLQTLLTKLLKP